MAVTHTYETIVHQVDLCVVGGGMAGLITAVTAARRGAKVLILQDRPVFGGNASSEIRMWICGARGADNKETGLLEEILLANYFRNPTLKYALWDSVLYETARFQPNLEMLLNCACTSVTTEGETITAVTGWQSVGRQPSRAARRRSMRATAPSWPHRWRVTRETLRPMVRSWVTLSARSRAGPKVEPG